jgi:hypothetical protein
MTSSNIVPLAEENLEAAADALARAFTTTRCKHMYSLTKLNVQHVRQHISPRCCDTECYLVKC